MTFPKKYECPLFGFLAAYLIAFELLYAGPQQDVSKNSGAEVVAAEYRRIGGGVSLPQPYLRRLEFLLAECPLAPSPPTRRGPFLRPERRIYFSTKYQTYIVFIKDNVFYERSIPPSEWEAVKQFCIDVDKLWQRKYAEKRKPKRK